MRSGVPLRRTVDQGAVRGSAKMWIGVLGQQARTGGGWAATEYLDLQRLTAPPAPLHLARQNAVNPPLDVPRGVQATMRWTRLLLALATTFALACSDPADPED